MWFDGSNAESQFFSMECLKNFSLPAVSVLLGVSLLNSHMSYSRSPNYLVISYCELRPTPRASEVAWFLKRPRFMKTINVQYILYRNIGWNFKELLHNKLRYTCGWAEVCPWLILFKNWTWPFLSVPIMCMHRVARPKVSLRWKDTITERLKISRQRML